MNELQECHRLVWAFRKEIEPYWATPDPLNSLRYAFTECAEAMDAWLRTERPSDSRNNDRNNDVLDELADCAIMLLTAIEDDKPFIHFRNPNGAMYEKDSLERIAKYIAECLLSTKQGTNSNNKIRVCVWRIANYPGMELKQRIINRLNDIAHKHAPDNLACKLVYFLNHGGPL